MSITVMYFFFPPLSPLSPLSLSLQSPGSRLSTTATVLFSSLTAHFMFAPTSVFSFLVSFCSFNRMTTHPAHSSSSLVLHDRSSFQTLSLSTPPSHKHTHTHAIFFPTEFTSGKKYVSLRALTLSSSLYLHYTSSPLFFNKKAVAPLLRLFFFFHFFPLLFPV